LDIEEKVDELLIMRFGAFHRLIVNTYIIPAKSHSHGIEDLTQVFYRDGSTEGLYPACVVTQELLGQVVIITPIAEFQKLLDAWKKQNPKLAAAARKIAVQEAERQKT